MRGEYDMLAAPSKELQEAYHKTFASITCDNLCAIPFCCKELGTLEEGMCPGVHEQPKNYVDHYMSAINQLIPHVHTLYSQVALHHILSTDIDLYAQFLLSIIKNKSTLILGNRDFKKEDLEMYFGPHVFIGGNSSNSFLERDRICSEFNEKLETLNTPLIVCILALGCGGRAMCHSFIETIQKQRKNVLIIDIGSSIDILMNLDTRAWITMTKPNVNRLKEIITSYHTNHTCHSQQGELTSLGLQYGTDKATYHGYTDFYEKLLCCEKNRECRIIEYGVATGASLRMLKSYFNYATIYSFDILLDGDPKLDNVYCSYANQDSCESLQNGLNDLEHNSIDFIIDDGGHKSSQQRNTLKVAWLYLKSKGLYIIEDIHTNVKHWYPNDHYVDESPSVLNDIVNLQYGLPNNLPINPKEVKQVIVWSQPSTTSMVVVLVKN
jgi:hypothetical protein